MLSPTMTPRALFNRVLGEVAREAGLAPEVIMGPSRARSAVHARAMIATRLLARGIPPVHIARIMRIQASAVHRYIGKSSPQEKSHGQDGSERGGDAGAARSAR